MTRRPPSSPLFPSPPLSLSMRSPPAPAARTRPPRSAPPPAPRWRPAPLTPPSISGCSPPPRPLVLAVAPAVPDRKSTRLNSSHLVISYAVFCLKKKKNAHLIVLQAQTANKSIYFTPQQRHRAPQASHQLVIHVSIAPCIRINVFPALVEHSST